MIKDKFLFAIVVLILLCLIVKELNDRPPLVVHFDRSNQIENK
jgi:hypothetical protein